MRALLLLTGGGKTASLDTTVRWLRRIDALRPPAPDPGDLNATVRALRTAMGVQASDLHWLQTRWPGALDGVAKLLGSEPPVFWTKLTY